MDGGRNVRFLMTTTAGQAPDEKMMTEMGQLVEELTWPLHPVLAREGVAA